MKFKTCKMCNRVYNPMTVKECPICKELHNKAFIYYTSFEYEKAILNKKIKRFKISYAEFQNKQRN